MELIEIDSEEFILLSKVPRLEFVLKSATISIEDQKAYISVHKGTLEAIFQVSIHFKWFDSPQYPLNI